MRLPRLAILVNGSPESVEGVRARGLTQGYPAERLSIHYRHGSRVRTALRWHRQLSAFRPDALYVVNTALPGILSAQWWRSRQKKPYLLDTGDLVYEMGRTAGTIPAWQRPWVRWWETLSWRNAHTLVVRGSRYREYLSSHGFSRVTLIRDGCQRIPGGVEPRRREELVRRWRLENRFVVGLMGSLVYSPRLKLCYGWDLLQALPKLADLPVTACIIGDGPGRPWLERKADALGIRDRVRFLGRVPYEEVPLYLSLLNVALSTQTNNLPGQVRTTGKLPEYMAAGVYVLASRVGEAERLLPQEMLIDYSGEVDHDYPNKLAARIRTLCSEPHRLQTARKLPGIAAEYCSYEHLSSLFQQTIAEIFTP